MNHMNADSSGSTGDNEAQLKTTEEQLVASIVFKGTRDQIAEKVALLRKTCGDLARAEPIVLFDYGVYSDAPEIEVCLPVSEPVTDGEVTSRVLRSGQVVAVRHTGLLEDLEKARSRLREYFRSRALVPALPLREVYIRWPGGRDEEAVVELQVGLHGWGKRLVAAIDEVLGDRLRSEIIGEGPELDDHGLTADQRFARVRTVVERLERETDSVDRYAVLSCCADRFSEKRIALLRKLYEETGSIDAVLEEMKKDFEWYEAPRREGSVVYVTKIPYDREAYEKADSPEDKRRSYCHCALVRSRLNQGMPSSYCYCGAGWYRQQWEGILRKPVRIKLLKSLLMGDDTCQYAIELPLDESLK